MAGSDSSGAPSIWLSVITAGGALAAAGLSAYVTYYTSVLEATISEKQAQTQQTIVELQESTKATISEKQAQTQQTIVELQESTKATISANQAVTQQTIAELQESTKRQISDLESSFKRAELFTRSIKELKDEDTSALVLMGLWPLFSRPEERRVIIAAALHVGNPEVIDALRKLGTELDPFLETVIQEAMSSDNPGVAAAATAFVKARKAEMLDGLLRPLVKQLVKVERASRRYTTDNAEPEATILREGNVRIRNLLREKADLVPADLKSDAGRLIEHYDEWLEEYERLGDKEASIRELVSVGPDVAGGVDATFGFVVEHGGILRQQIGSGRRNL